jgi:hypothetical protein
LKVEFLSRFLLEPVEEDMWEYGADFQFTVDGLLYVIRAGERTDLDSVPRLPLMYWIAKNRARKAAGVHDHLYRLQEGKDYADAAFYAAMLTEGVKQPYRAMIYRSVRLFGHSAYDKYGAPAETS